MILPTVRIVHPQHPEGVIVNASDLRDDHVLWSGGQAAAELQVGKGPRGLWYVKRGDEIASHGFKTEVEADAVRAELAK